MILITGGSGFIGLHTARALVDVGEQCVLTRYQVGRSPDFISDELDKNVFIEQLDVTDPDGFVAIGSRYEITGICHLATPGLGALTPLEEVRVNLEGLRNVFDAAARLGVPRVLLASSVSVYGGAAPAPLREDAALPMTAGNTVEAFKKAFELVGTYVSGRAGFDVVNLRIAYVYGPLYHSMANAPSRLVHAAVFGTALDGPGSRPIFAGDGGDLCYVKDCGRAIALLATADALQYSTYNIGSGVPTSWGEVAESVRRAVPGAELSVASGTSPNATGRVDYLDLSRITSDTGYEPAYDIDRAITDYVAWLRAGNAQ